MELQPEHIFLAMAVLAGKPKPKVDIALQPAFYLHDTVYVFNETELSKAGEHFIYMAYYETYRYIWVGYADYLRGFLSEDEWATQHYELQLGLCSLRGLLKTSEVLLPNGHYYHVN